jgi:hypothetical protein
MASLHLAHVSALQLLVLTVVVVVVARWGRQCANGVAVLALDCMPVC